MNILNWSEIAFAIQSKLQRSTELVEIDRRSWPEWATRSTQFERIWVFSPRRNQIPNGMSTAQVIGKLITERFETNDAKPFNYNYYLIVATTDGRYLQSSPIKTTDIDHHSYSPPAWLESRPKTT